MFNVVKSLLSLLLLVVVPALLPMALTYWLEGSYVKPCRAADGHFTLIGCVKKDIFLPYK